MKGRFMPLICVGLVTILFGTYFLFLHNPEAENSSTESTQPTIEAPLVTEPTVNPTEPTNPEPSEPSEPEDTQGSTAPTNPIIYDKKYVGVYTEELEPLAEFQNGINTIGWFDTFDKVSTAKLAACLDEKIYTGFVTLEPANMSLSGIANGEYDEKIIAYLQELSRGDRVQTEIFIRFAHEMEMRPSYGKPWYSWQGNDAETYIAAWRHVITLGREYAPNVKWVWSPNRADQYTERYYPGDEYVDCVGVTLNNTMSSYPEFDTYYEKIGQRSYVEIYNKPIIFGEVARHRYDSESQMEYIVGVLDYVQEYENCLGVVFFNKDVTRDRRYQFSNNNESMRIFIEKAKELLTVEE